jgi:hypothetical protein
MGPAPEKKKRERNDLSRFVLLQINLHFGFG